MYGQSLDQAGACFHGEQSEAIKNGAHNEKTLSDSDNTQDRVERWLEDQARYYVCNEQADQAMSTSKPTEQSKSGLDIRDAFQPTVLCTDIVYTQHAVADNAAHA